MKQTNQNGSQRRMFTPEEDLLIVTLINGKEKKNWKEIANYLNGRTPRQVRERFRNYLSPGIVNGPWTREEDEYLKTLHLQFGSKWSKISSFFKNRSEINIKNRWSSISKNNQSMETIEPASNVHKEEHIKIDNSTSEFDFAFADDFNNPNSRYDLLDFSLF
ncbi:Myb-like DNA-binding domain containing protein [Trichomonas vaginalis G3]|uniref:Myb-like DNA-binding domain containing protein n=1 Tax=Trichomonas vaginalis (strain ATCC PRA-98 / G3) TaxID=412133 RepID=A2DF75_TRIV3|nr:RNA polymerase II transcription regulator recruiting protein [Trichomonas vaginalis G3]EAY21067.1 Myb-like DNA-binding domain containing protein [Trichomonas vaginalis G3]KAI5532822.1 RNA polymerase II transcription regulator recruiting protein [Trichomonas vaginalis G3]|eukprot:XP_001582053.1 Myb-like DNA-binding domain containing protein [Trichomonas vaginalis G3]